MNLGMDGALSALIGAAIAGGLAIAAGIVAVMALPVFSYGPPSLADAVTGLFMVLVMVIMLAIYTTFVFAAGLLLLGLPAWAALHSLGWRTRRAAVPAGGVLAGARAAGLAFALDGPNGGAAGFAGLMVLSGGVAGWVLHRIAYDTADPAAR